ncbi:hypothetical protein MHYP_G00041550 [Metynnis hypsauchen]
MTAEEEEGEKEEEEEEEEEEDEEEEEKKKKKEETSLALCCYVKALRRPGCLGLAQAGLAPGIRVFWGGPVMLFTHSSGAPLAVLFDAEPECEFPLAGMDRGSGHFL